MLWIMVEKMLTNNVLNGLRLRITVMTKIMRGAGARGGYVRKAGAGVF